MSLHAAYNVMRHVRVFSCDALLRELGSGGHADGRAVTKVGLGHELRFIGSDAGIDSKVGFPVVPGGFA